MKHYVPEDPQERLNQLNEWFTKAIFSTDVFNDDKWLPIRLNLSKWKATNFSVLQNVKPEELDFTDHQKGILYFIYNSISEILLFEKEIKLVAGRQQFERAALYRDLSDDCTKALTEEGKQNGWILPFFSMNGQTLILKCVDNYFVQLIIKERLRF